MRVKQSFKVNIFVEWIFFITNEYLETKETAKAVENNTKRTLNQAKVTGEKSQWNWFENWEETKFLFLQWEERSKIQQ